MKLKITLPVRAIHTWLNDLNTLFKSLFFIVFFICQKSVLFSGAKDDGFLIKESVDKTLDQINPAQLKVLETVNSFYGHWCCANNGYLYGMDPYHKTIVLRKTESGQAFEKIGSVASLDTSFTIEYKMFSTSTPGLLFILVKNNSGYFMLKSCDGAATFTNVFTFGAGNGIGGTNAPDTRILRGILELKRDLPKGGGIGTLYIGEYNVCHPRTSGSTNDRVRIMKSVDNGDTWTKVVEWNTNGINQVGHVHAMKQDPYTGEIYICVGDDNNKSGIIKWDGSAGWADNKTLAEIGSMNGFKVLTGAQRYRACDVLFDEKYFYAFADTQTPNNPTGSESGIWRGAKDLASYTRVDNKIYNYDPMHVGWFGEKIGNTFIFTTAREYIDSANAWKELNTKVYTSTDGINWYTSGVLNWRDLNDPTLGRYINNLFSVNNNLYVDCYEGAGHTSTIQCELTKEWNSYEDPVILHPVFFVGTWNAPGNDANPGTNPDAPKLTLNSALISNKICAGARVKVAAGNFSETNIYPLWSGAGLQGRGSVVIEGQGMNETHIIRSSGSGDTYGIYLVANRTLTDGNTPLIFKDLDFYITIDGGVNHYNNVFINNDSYIRTIRCRIGNSANDDSPLVKLAGAGTKYVSENSIHIANINSSPFKSIVESKAKNTVIYLKNCIALNAYDALSSNYAGTNFSLKNTNFYGIERYAVVFNVNPITQPVIKNCIFTCGKAPICDLSRLKEIYIDNNLYNKSNINVTDGGHSLAVGTDPLFVDAVNWNFDLQSNSPCNMNGIFLSDVLYDFVNRERKNPPSIGAYERPALIVTPPVITISSTSGATGEFIITSNTGWNVSEDDTWLNLSSLSGTGNGKIIFTATRSNTSIDSRSTIVTFSATGLNPVAVTVTQSGDILTTNHEIKKRPLNIYPNPVTGILNIEYNDDNFSSIYILNSQGVILTKEKVVAPIQQLDFSKYEYGLYILEFVNPSGEVKKVKVVNH